MRDTEEMLGATSLTHLVGAPLGVVLVALDRRGLGLGARGGFEARWATPDEAQREPLGLEAYRRVVKAHLKEIYLQEEGREPPGIALNLASHQLIDDLTGWTKLNAPPPEARSAP